MANKKAHKTIVWIGGSQEVLRDFPEEVRRAVGFALWEVQNGIKPLSAKPLRGFGSAKVLEIVDSDESGTYRAVYTVKFADFVYVLHIFQKKSKKGSKTPQRDRDLIAKRLQMAQQHHQEWKKSNEERSERGK